MRFYLINLSEIPSESCDKKFFKKVFDNKLEWWRYFPLSFILATPDDLYTNTLSSWILNSYGAIFFTVIEIDIKDVGGAFPTKFEYFKKGGVNPFDWFKMIRAPKYIPKWEKEKKS